MGETFDSSFAHDLASQSWALYGIGMFTILFRTYVSPSGIYQHKDCKLTIGRFARWRRVRSLSHFAVDDWLMVSLVPLFYTGLVTCLNIIANGGGSNLYPPEQFSTFSQTEIEERIKGSKIVVVSEQV